MTRKVIVKIEGISPMLQSHAHMTPKKSKELADAYEERTWQEKAHTVDGFVAIPTMAFKQSLDEVAQHLGLQIPGKGKSTYTKHFKRGVTGAGEYSLTNVPVSAITKKAIFCNSNGQRGGGTRVMRFFPAIVGWTADVEFMVVDDIITEEVLDEFLKQAGLLIGVGAFRVGNGGISGRFRPVSYKWTEIK